MRVWVWGGGQRNVTCTLYTSKPHGHVGQHGWLFQEFPGKDACLPARVRKSELHIAGETSMIVGTCRLPKAVMVCCFESGPGRTVQVAKLLPEPKNPYLSEVYSAFFSVAAGCLCPLYDFALPSALSPNTLQMMGFWVANTLSVVQKAKFIVYCWPYYPLCSALAEAAALLSGTDNADEEVVNHMEVRRAGMRQEFEWVGQHTELQEIL